MTKKFTPDYFGWILLFLFNIVVLLFCAWFIWLGLAYEKDYTFDLLGYSLASMSFLLFLMQFYELYILIKFIVPELGRTFSLDIATKELTITQKGNNHTISLGYLDSIILSERRIATRSATAHLSYAQLNFRNREPILITSFLHNHKKLKELINLNHVKVISRNRKLFEGIQLH